MQEARTKAEAWLFSPRFWLFVGALVVAGAVVVFSLPRGVRWYGRLKAKSLARRAASASTNGDIQSALVQAGKALALDPNNALATRTVAGALHAAGGASMAIQWHRRLEELEPGDAQNLITWADDALKTGDPAGAEAALNKVKPADRNNAAYHEAAAGIALARGDQDSAESHFAEAMRLDPGQSQHKLNLSMLQLRSAKPQVRDEALQVLEGLRARPETNLAALRLLIEDAGNRNKPDKVRELGKAIEANANARLGDRLAFLSARRAVEDPDFFTNLEQLKAASVHDADDLAGLIAWMNEHQLAIAACEWIPSLPAALTSKPPVSLAVADAFARAGDWTRLKESLEASPPDHLDFFRLALQARLL